MLECKPITFRTIRDAPRLLAEYAEECSISLIGKPDPQWDTYEALEASGALAVFGVFVDEKLVGFASVLAYILPHYGVMAGTVESLFVSSPYRGTGAGLYLMRAVETFARLVGCKAILYSAPVGGKLEALLDRSATRTNAVFCKALPEHPRSTRANPFSTGFYLSVPPGRA